MNKLKKYLICAVAVLLCIMLESPTILPAATKRVFADSINIQTASCTTMIQVLDKTLPAKQTSRIETFANGTRKVSISLNFTLQHGGIRVSMETLIQPKTAEAQSEMPNYSATATSSDLYPYTAVWDYLNFLIKGHNDSCVVSYNHDNNYDSRGYYPGDWYKDYSLPNALYPAPLATHDHIHIPTNVMTDWYNGVVDRQTVVGIVMGLAGGVMAVITGVVAIFIDPLAAILTIIAGVSSIIGWILAILGYNEQNWIRDVVTEKYSGDGWTWTWGARIINTFCWIFHPPIFDIYTENDLYILQQFHRVGIGICNTMQFKQSWGADRDSPQTYTIDVWGEDWVNSGFFGTGGISK